MPINLLRLNALAFEHNGLRQRLFKHRKRYNKRNLSKGQKVDLTKGNPGLKHIMVGLGWDVNAFDSGADFDLDAAAFMVGDNGRCPTEKEFIFYGNLLGI